MRVLDAFELVRARTTEHHAEGEGAGLTIVMEQLGIDPDDMQDAMPSVFYEHTVINMPVPAQLVAAFVAGAVYTRANHAGPSEPVDVTEEMVDRALGAAADPILAGTAEHTDLPRLRMRVALETAFGGPAAGPPADGGAEASS